MAEQLRIQVLRRGQEVTLSGRLDVRSAAVARALLHEAVAAGQGDLLVHVTGMEIWDASGLGVLVGAHRRAGQLDRRLVLTGVLPGQVRLLHATRLHRLFTLEPWQPTAVA